MNRQEVNGSILFCSDKIMKKSEDNRKIIIFVAEQEKNSK
jgi:hypothetical protein